jgi:putative transposase
VVAFINDHREAYGVESICGVVPIAPSTYYRHRARQIDPTKRAARAVRDEVLKAIIERIWREHDQAYGSRKVWKQMGREGLRAARCRVRRLMRELGLVGVVRGRAWTTTTQANGTAERPADLVDRHFVATRPNQLWVADFTYVATWAGFVYVAFVIDVFARRIVGWRVSSSLRRSKRSTPAVTRRSATWCITATAGVSTFRCGMPTGWPTPASNRQLAVAGIRTTMPWPSP